jgi:hypothetical protein
MSYNKNRRNKERERDRKYQDKAESDIKKMKDDDIKTRANKIIDDGLIKHAMSDDVIKGKKKNKSLVDKFKRLLKFKRK